MDSEYEIEHRLAMIRATIIIVMGVTVLVFILFAEYKSIKENIPKTDSWIKRPKDTCEIVCVKGSIGAIDAIGWDLRPLEKASKMFKSDFV